MEQKRNSYLISSAMKSYLAAAIASMLIQNVNTIVDGILMGRFLGTDAFSAVNLCLPVVGAVASMAMLFYAGATILTSLAMGAREEKKANDIFTVSIISVLGAAVVIAVLALLGINQVTNAICTTKELKPYVRDYVFVYFAGCPVTMTVSALLQFTDVGGRPKLVTMCSGTNVVTNILCDIFYVAVLGFGIRGAALATITGSVASLLIVLVDGRLHGSIFKLQRVGSAFGQYLKENIKYGLPMMLNTVATVVYSYVCSISAQRFCGVNGAFVVSLLTQATSLCQGVSGGIAMSFNAIGGMLTGQKDYIGVRFLFKKGITISIIFSAIFAGAVMLFAPQFATVMGAEGEALLAYSARAVRIALPFVVPITIVWSMPSVLVIAGKRNIISKCSIAQPVITFITLWGCAMVFGNDNMWIGYPVGSLIILAFLILLTEMERKKGDISRSFLSLLPNEKSGTNIFDISVACKEESLVETLNETIAFFDGQDIEKGLSTRVRLCAEEMMLNIIEHANRSTNQYLDYKIIINENSVLTIIKDDGKQFDPIHAEAKGAGLKIVNALCPSLEYKYTYGQNMTFMTWER